MPNQGYPAMIIALILPIAAPVIACICLVSALRPSRGSRWLLIATAAVLLLFSVWYVGALILGIW